MADFKFNCPQCKQPLEAPEIMIGTKIGCPSCQKPITVPDPVIEITTPISQPPPAQQKQTKACPFCSEEILSSAIKCKHCGEFLDGRGKPATAVSHAQPKPPSPPQSEKEIWKANPSFLAYIPVFIIGTLLIPIFGIGLLIILYAVLSRNTTVFTLTNRRATAKSGIISRTMREVGTKDIRNINVSQGILGRIFGIGTVEIESAAAAGQGHVQFISVEKPLVVRDLVRHEKDTADSR